MFSSDMLAAFLLVAERGSFTAAAEEAGVAKGVISKRVGQLEARLGHPLLRRTTRSVHLTPAGELFLPTARRILMELEAGAEALSALRSEPSGLVRVTAPISWGMEVLAKLLPGFLQSHPRIEVELILSDALLDLAHERIDVALRMTGAPAQDHVAVPLARLERILCASPKYLKTHGAPRVPAELANHSCLAYWTEPGVQSWGLARRNERKTISVRSRYRVNNPNAVKDAVSAGLGIGLLPEYVCGAELAAGKLVRVLPEWRPETRFGTRLHAVGLPERIRLARCQAILDYLRQALAEK